MLIKNIKWDTDGDMEALASLPTEVYTPPFLHQEQYDDIEEFLDDVSDWLSDEYGWCHFGFETETDDGGITNATRCPNEAERKKYHESRNQICHNEKRSQGIYVHLQR